MTSDQFTTMQDALQRLSYNASGLQSLAHSANHLGLLKLGKDLGLYADSIHECVEVINNAERDAISLRAQEAEERSGLLVQAALTGITQNKVPV